jgi:hypothetical protein
MNTETTENTYFTKGTPYWGNLVGEPTGYAAAYYRNSLEPGLTECLWVFDWGTEFQD